MYWMQQVCTFSCVSGLLTLSTSPIHAVLLVYFEQEYYNVSEDEGVLSACVVLEGMTERDVMVNVSTQDVTAVGRLG